MRLEALTWLKNICRLYGVMLTQTYKYFQRFQRDPLLIKLLASYIVLVNLTGWLTSQCRSFWSGTPHFSEPPISGSIFIAYYRLLNTVSLFFVGHAAWSVISTAILIIILIYLQVLPCDNRSPQCFDLVYNLHSFFLTLGGVVLLIWVFLGVSM